MSGCVAPLLRRPIYVAPKQINILKRNTANLSAKWKNYYFSFFKREQRMILLVIIIILQTVAVPNEEFSGFAVINHTLQLHWFILRLQWSSKHAVRTRNYRNVRYAKKRLKIEWKETLNKMNSKRKLRRNLRYNSWLLCEKPKQMSPLSYKYLRSYNVCPYYSRANSVLPSAIKLRLQKKQASEKLTGTK